MKVLITGAKGQLGQDLIKAFAGHEVIAYDIDELDITDSASVEQAIKKIKPDTIIHSAAYTNVDGCETEQDTAFKVNATGTANLAMAANEVDAQILYVSTDYVFDGTSNKPYVESDTVSPQSVYGASKRAGEEAVMSATDKWYIARTAWLYGHGGQNFVKTIQKIANEKDKLKVVDDQKGSPTYTADLANKIAEVVGSGLYGLYHVTNQGFCTWYDFAAEILRLSDIKAELEPCTTDEFPRPAKRPAYSVLANHNLKLKGFKPMRSWQEALEAYFKL